MNFYAYIHAKPDGTPFYVGKGSGTRIRHMMGRNPYHRNIVAKYGADAILIGKLDCSTEEIAFDLERGLIKCLRRMGISLANMTDGGEGPSGFVHSAETRAKLKGNQYSRGVIRSARERALVSAARKGKPLSDEHRKKLSESHKGQIVTEYTKQRLHEVHAGNKYNLGRKLSDAHKKKISAAGKGRVVSEEAREKLRVANLGRKISEETRQKLRDSHTGKVMSEETRLKMSKAQLARQAAIRTLQTGD